MIFSAHGFDKSIDPYYEHLYRVNVNGSNFKILTPGNYDNNFYLGDRGYFVNNYSRVNKTPKSNLIDMNGNIIKKEARKNPGLTSIQDDFDLNKPQLNVQIDQKKAADLGVSTEDIGRTIETIFKESGENYFRNIERYIISHFNKKKMCLGFTKNHVQ